MACFNLREGRFRQSNLHLVRPARIVQPPLHRGDVRATASSASSAASSALAWRLLRERARRLRRPLLLPADALRGRRWIGAAYRRLADCAAPLASRSRASSAVSAILLRASFRFVVTEAGGAAIDIDNEHDFDVAKLRYAEWCKPQRERAEHAATAPALLGPGAAAERARTMSAGAAGAALPARRAGLFRLRGRGPRRGRGRGSRALAERHAQQRRRGARPGPRSLGLLRAAADAASAASSRTSTCCCAATRSGSRRERRRWRRCSRRSASSSSPTTCGSSDRSAAWERLALEGPAASAIFARAAGEAPGLAPECGADFEIAADPACARAPGA